jgi:putative transposase
VLPSLQAFCAADPMSERVVEQIVLGVSTRGYERSLESVPAGTSKSSASRALIDGTTQKLAEFLDRRLDDVELIAMFIDGLEIADKTTVVALGVTTDGTKVPLGIWLGSTENTALTTSLVQNLLERGLRVAEKTLFVVDGGKGIRRALQDVYGDNAVVQRCQVHKTRNVRDICPKNAVRM